MLLDVRIWLVRGGEAWYFCVMKRMTRILAWVVAGGVWATGAYGLDPEKDFFAHTVYLQQSNGLFQVATLDEKAQEITAWRGLFLEKEHIPKPGPFISGRPSEIYALPELRPADSYPSPTEWHVPTEEYYIYTPPAVPVVERNPPMVAWRLKNGRIAVGVKCFYVMAELEREEIPETAKLVRKMEGLLKPVAYSPERDELVGEWLRHPTGGGRADYRMEWDDRRRLLCRLVTKRATFSRELAEIARDEALPPEVRQAATAALERERPGIRSWEELVDFWDGWFSPDPRIDKMAAVKWMDELLDWAPTAVAIAKADLAAENGPPGYLFYLRDSLSWSEGEFEALKSAK